MYDIEMHAPTRDFAECWSAAGQYLFRHGGERIATWLRMDLVPPFLEHLSFRVGNQLFFIRLEDVDGRIVVPGNREGLLAIAAACKGFPCLMPMKKSASDNKWTPARGAWSLVDARTGEPVDPPSLVTDQKVEMTDWEVHDFGVQVVRNHLTEKGFKLMSAQGNPNVDPSLWFVGDSGKPEWVVVRTVRYPAREALRPKNWSAIAEGCARLSAIGHFASVAFASGDQEFRSNHEPAVPLWRGHKAIIEFEGLS